MVTDMVKKKQKNSLSQPPQTQQAKLLQCNQVLEDTDEITVRSNLQSFFSPLNYWLLSPSNIYAAHISSQTKKKQKKTFFPCIVPHLHSRLHKNIYLKKNHKSLFST